MVHGDGFRGHCGWSGESKGKYDLGRGRGLGLMSQSSGERDKSYMLPCGGG